MGGKMSLDSHVREQCKTGLNITELNMPADFITSQQLDPLGSSFVLQNTETAALVAS